MNTTAAQMTEYLVAKGWTKDRFGNLKTTRDGWYEGQKVTREYRIKFQAHSFRYECKSMYLNSCGQHEWNRIGGDYFKNTTVTDKGIVISNKPML